MTGKMHNIRRKIFGGADRDLERLLALWRFSGDSIVFTNGCFDVLHPGHIECLAKAADFGDRLVVGVNSDASVRALKGPGRPLLDEQSRALILAALHLVDAVVLFSEPAPHNLIKFVRPRVLVKGGDYREEDVAGADIVRQNGGSVEIIGLVPGYSTTAIEKKIREHE